MSHHDRRQSLLLLVLVATAGCAGRGDLNRTGLLGNDASSDASFFEQGDPILAARLNPPPIATNENSRLAQPISTVVDPSQSIRQASVATVVEPPRLPKPKATSPTGDVPSIYRHTSHRMQVEATAPPVLELDTPELSAPKDAAQREAEARLAAAREAEQRAAEEREQAERELEQRIAAAKEAARQAEMQRRSLSDVSLSGISLSDVAAGSTEFMAIGVPASMDSGQPIDLGSALGMAGGNAWTIQLARQKTVEAHAEVDRSEAIWLPNLQVGVGWTKHEGRIQVTEGQVIEASRNSVFIGGGATLGNAPIAGGGGGPLRLTADLAIADAYFGPKIARRNFQASRFGVSVAKNDAMRDAGLAYMNLLESAGQIADAQAAISAAEELVQLTEKFEAAGAGAQADVDRAATERSRLQQVLQNASRLYRVRSAGLARQLRLDPTSLLQPADQYLVPVTLATEVDDPLAQIATALSQRPEICRQSQVIAALSVECRKEEIAPWIPHVTMATSAGFFSGGRGSTTASDGGRGDLDLQALWELENMGLGVAAKRKRVASRLAQERYLLADLRDQIRAEVVQANENVANYWQQIQSAESALASAEASYQRNLLRVQNDEGLPIELLQAINARFEGLRARTTAVAGYNRAQIELLYAIGQLVAEVAMNSGDPS